MSPSVETQLANHGARLITIEENQRTHDQKDDARFKEVGESVNRMDDKLDAIKMWLIGVLGAALVEIAIHVLKHG